jgi:hypothetical protein
MLRDQNVKHVQSRSCIAFFAKSQKFMTFLTKATHHAKIATSEGVRQRELMQKIA